MREESVREKLRRCPPEKNDYGLTEEFFMEMGSRTTLVGCYLPAGLPAVSNSISKLPSRKNFFYSMEISAKNPINLQIISGIPPFPGNYAIKPPLCIKKMAPD